MVEQASVANRAKVVLRLIDPQPKIERLASAETAGRCKALWASLKRRLSHADLDAVRLISRSAQSRIGRASAIAISRLGNGWLYMFIGLIVFEQLGNKSFRV